MRRILYAALTALCVAGTADAARVVNKVNVQVNNVGVGAGGAAVSVRTGGGIGTVRSGFRGNAVVVNAGTPVAPAVRVGYHANTAFVGHSVGYGVSANYAAPAVVSSVAYADPVVQVAPAAVVAAPPPVIVQQQVVQYAAAPLIQFVPLYAQTYAAPVFTSYATGGCYGGAVATGFRSAGYGVHGGFRR